MDLEIAPQDIINKQIEETEQKLIELKGEREFARKSKSYGIARDLTKEIKELEKIVKEIERETREYEQEQASEDISNILAKIRQNDRGFKIE